MSLTDVRPYFRDKMKDLGYEEWDHPFDNDQMHDRYANKGFYLPATDFSESSHNQSDLEILLTQNVEFLIQGFRNPMDALDDCMRECDSIIKSMLNFKDRLTGNLTDVKLVSFNPEEYATDNTNIVRCILVFNVLLHIDVRG